MAAEVGDWRVPGFYNRCKQTMQGKTPVSRAGGRDWRAPGWRASVQGGAAQQDPLADAG